MLDRAEDPEKIVRLIIQEMEDTLVEVRARAARSIADKKEIERKRQDVAARVTEWERKAEFAISKGRDDLARGAVGAKRKAQEMADILTKECAVIDQSLNKTNDDLATLQEKLKQAKSKQRSIAIRTVAATDGVRVNRHIHDTRLDDALARYDQWERRIDELEGEAESFAMGTDGDTGRKSEDASLKSLAREIADLEVEEEINAEVERLRKRITEQSNS